MEVTVHKQNDWQTTVRCSQPDTCRPRIHYVSFVGPQAESLANEYRDFMLGTKPADPIPQGLRDNLNRYDNKLLSVYGNDLAHLCNELLIRLLRQAETLGELQLYEGGKAESLKPGLKQWRAEYGGYSYTVQADLVVCPQNGTGFLFYRDSESGELVASFPDKAVVFQESNVKKE